MSKKINKDYFDVLEGYKTFALIAIFIAVLVYIFTLTGLDISIKDTTDLGTIGDFFGGLLSPTFALIGLFALLATIKIQSKELKLTRKELKKSSKSLKKQSDSFKIQNKSIAHQNFENTFFKMLDLHNEIITNITLVPQDFKKEKILDTKNMPKKVPGLEKKDLPYKTIETPNKYKIDHYEINLFDKTNYLGKKVLEQLLKILKQYIKERGNEYLSRHQELYNHFHNEYQNIIGHYFGTIYQVLKFIKENKDEGKIENDLRYAHLFRSQFSKAELELLFYHGQGEIGRKRFISLLIEFEFFEHLNYSNDIDEEFISYYINEEEGKAFGKNMNWILERQDRATPN